MRLLKNVQLLGLHSVANAAAQLPHGEGLIVFYPTSSDADRD